MEQQEKTMREDRFPYESLIDFEQVDLMRSTQAYIGRLIKAISSNVSEYKLSAKGEHFDTFFVTKNEDLSFLYFGGSHCSQDLNNEIFSYDAAESKYTLLVKKAEEERGQVGAYYMFIIKPTGEVKEILHADVDTEITNYVGKTIKINIEMMNKAVDALKVLGIHY